MNTSMLIKKLKQQTRHGQTPPEGGRVGVAQTSVSVARPAGPATPSRVSPSVTEQVQQLAQSLANQMVAEMQHWDTLQFYQIQPLQIFK